MLFKIAKFSIIALLLWVALMYLIPQVTSEEFRVFVQGAGALGPIAVIGYIIFAHILAPVTATPVVVSSFAIFGIYEAMFYIYTGGIISSVINFYISRKWGRGIVARFVGRKMVHEVDKYAEVFGTKALIVGRVFGFAVFEVISYAAGLTNISFKKYITITVIFSAIPSIIFGILFRDFDFSTMRGLLVWLGVLVITGIMFSFLMRKIFFQNKSHPIEGDNK